MQTQEIHRSSWRVGFYISTFVVFLSCTYAFIRYVVVRHVSLDHVPLYISNKAVALASVIIIGLSFLLGSLASFFPSFQKHLHLRKSLGIYGFGLASLHALISLALLSPAYYGKFYGTSGKLNLTGESVILFGILAFLIFSTVAISSLPSVAERLSQESWKRIQRMGYLAYFFVLLHVGVMGWKGWLDPASWKYGLASFSLISALTIVLVLVLRTLSGIFFKRK